MDSVSPVWDEKTDGHGLGMCSGALESVGLSGEWKDCKEGGWRAEAFGGLRGPWAVSRTAVSVLGEMNDHCHVLGRSEASDFLCDTHQGADKSVGCRQPGQKSHDPRSCSESWAAKQ